MSKEFTLGKKERLKSRKLIDQLFSEGKKFGVAPFRVFYRIEKDNGTALQFGVGVSSKHFKKSTDRNRVKRLVREAYRLQKNKLKEQLKEQNVQLAVFIIYTDRELPLYNDVFVKMEKVLDKLFTISGDRK